MIVARNLTQFFNREIMIYAFGDIKLKKPLPMKTFLWTVVGFACWALPILIIFGLRLEPIFLAIVVIPPIVFGRYASRPVFGGKTMFAWAQAQINYMTQPRGWSDFKVDNDQQDAVYNVSHEISVSRRRDLAYLTQLELEENPDKYYNHRGSRRKKSTRKNNENMKDAASVPAKRNTKTAGAQRKKTRDKDVQEEEVVV